MKKILLYPFLPVLLALSACAETPEQAFAKAQKEFAEHDYNAARISLANALTAKPGDKAMLQLQARTLLALGDGEGAGTAIEQLAGKRPAVGEMAELAAEAALLRSSPDAAIAFLSETKSVEADRLRALAAVQKNDLAGAANFFERGMEAGGSPRLFADYARLRLLGGDLPGAAQLAAKASAAAPNGIDTLLINGEIAIRHGDLNGALGFYERAAKLYPASIAALTGKAAVLGELGRYDDMQAVLQKAAVAAPKNLSIAYLQARLAVQKKDWEAVRAIVQPLESALPQISPMRQLYAEALLHLGSFELAIAQLQPIVQAMPANRDAVRLLAEALLGSGDANAALATIKPLVDGPLARADELALAGKIAKAAGSPAANQYEARSHQPQPQSLGRDLADADAAMRAGNWAGAAAAYQRVLAGTDGRNIMVLNNMAYAQLMLGNVDQALDYSGRALKLAPDNPSVIDTAGWARFRAGRIDEARRLLRRAAELAPRNSTIRAHLAEAQRTGG